MIYVGFILDYFVMLFLPIDTFFVINDIEDNRFLSVLFLGMILDIIYHKLFINLIILLSFYFILKILKIKKKYKFIKNIFLYFLYFSILHIMFGVNDSYVSSFVVGLIFQIIYISLSKVLSK